MTTETTWQEDYLKKMAAGISVYELDRITRERDIFREALQTIHGCTAIGSREFNLAKEALENDI